ncbi:MAG: hypothetical protein ACP5PX_07275 [Candidatus Hadarchaeum sp.]|uniref:hypothetical protein n=1 Tax=Candidatus Hadarchaeum sp. TaxID=2883567 RepID=UPI003D0E4EE2
MAERRKLDKVDVVADFFARMVVYLFLLATATFIASAVSERSLVEGFKRWPMSTWWTAVLYLPGAALLAVTDKWLERRKREVARER